MPELKPINIGAQDCPTNDDLRHLVVAQNKLLAKMEESNKTLLLKMDSQSTKVERLIKAIDSNTTAVIDLTELIRSHEYAKNIAVAIKEII